MTRIRAPEAAAVLGVERIVAAAIKHTGVTVSLPRPARHGDIFITAGWMFRKVTVLPSHQGFLTSEGRFVGREEARQIAIDAGQCPGGPAHARELFSEDLW